MSQLNIQVTPEFAEALARFMKARSVPTKSQAIRLAVQEGLEHALGLAAPADFRSLVGIGNGAPRNRSPRYRSDDDLWKK